jgi:hypothetical protein
MESPRSQHQLESKVRLEGIRRQYGTIDITRRGAASDRSAHHVDTIADWHPHRKEAAKS